MTMDANYLILGFILGTLTALPICIALALRAMRGTPEVKRPTVVFFRVERSEQPKVEPPNKQYWLN